MEKKEQPKNTEIKTDDKAAKTSAPTKPSGEKPAAKPAAKATNPANKPTAKPASKTANKPTAKPASAKPADEKPAEKPAAKPVEEKPIEKPAVNPAEEKPVEKPAEEKPIEKATEKPAEEQPTEEKKEPPFIADPKDRRPRGYASRVQLAARYTDEQAQNMLRKRIYQYKEVHLRFLRKVEEPTAFSTERLFVPVYCGKSDVRYTWKTKANKTETHHEEISTKERRFSGANKDLDATNFLLENVPEVLEKKPSDLLTDETYNFKKTVQAFNTALKATAPAKNANVEKRGEEYTLVYVPVLKTVCTLDGEKYVGYVNLYNGACYSSYKVSDMVAKAAEKAELSAKLSKRTLWTTFIFSLTLCLLTVLAALKLADWKIGNLTTETVWTACLLAVLCLPSMALAIGVNAVKKESLIEKAVKLNKLPGVAWPRFAAVVGVLCMLGAEVLFFFQVLI